MPDTAAPRNPPDGRPLVDAVLDRLQPAPFWDHLGCTLTGAEPGRATVRFPNRPEHGRSSNTGDGTAHGGAIASLVDMAASCALLTVLAEDESRTTIDLTIHYLAPGRGTLNAIATVRRRGGRTAVIDIEVAGGDGSLIALGRAVFAIVKDRGS
ncbi:MAG: PaaI family thioesterase [Microbacteriaceae bacterium]